MGILKKKML